MKNNKRILLSMMIIFICWLPQSIFLYQVPTKEISVIINSISEKELSKLPDEIRKKSFDDTKYQTKNIYKDLWIAWILKFSMLIFGILTGIFIFFNVKKIKYLSILSSSLYLYTWFVSGSTYSVNIIQSYALKLNLAEDNNMYLSFFYKDVLLPFLFILIIIIMAYDMLNKNKNAI